MTERVHLSYNFKLDTFSVSLLAFEEEAKKEMQTFFLMITAADMF